MSVRTRTGARIRSLWQEEQAFILLLALFVAFRLMALVYFRPGGFIRDWSDYTTYLGVARLSDQGLFPSIHFWLEYPPLFPWLLVGLYRLSLLMPVWTDPRLWFNLLLGLVLLLFESGSFVLLYLLGKRLRGREESLRLCAVYALLFAPLYVLLGYYDTIPAAFMLLGLYWIVRVRAAGSGAALGVGFALKLTPIVLSAVAVRTMVGIRSRAAHLIAAALSILLLSLPFLLTRADLYLMSFRSALGRASWETPWALLEGYYSYGVVAGDRFDPAVREFANHPGTLPWLPITLVFAAVALWVYTRPIDYADARKILALATFTMTWFILYSKGYSPQFAVYLLPLLLCSFPLRRAVPYALILGVLNLLEHPIYFVMLPDSHWLLVGIVAWRTALLLVILWDSVCELGLAPLALIHVRRHALAWLAAGLLIWMAVAGAGMGRAFYELGYTTESYRPVVEFLSEQEPRPLLFTDDDVYRRLYPYLHSRLELRVTTTSRVTWSDDMQAWAAQRKSFWLWRGDRTDPDLETWLRAHTRPVTSQQFDQGQLFLLAVSEDSVQ